MKQRVTGCPIRHPDLGHVRRAGSHRGQDPRYEVLWYAYSVQVFSGMHASTLSARVPHLPGQE